MGGGTLNRSWEEDIYWTHFQFLRFTLFLSTTDFQQQLALPKTFSNNLKNKLPANVTLKGPSGVVWDIGLTTRDETVYSMNGWQQFVKDHSLKQNDFLVFKYNGESLFEVLIFHGEILCEKAASYFVLECGQADTEQEGSKEKDTNTSVEEVNSPSNGGVECGSPEKSWEENIYWTHFQFIHFTQFLRTDFEQQLALPKTFSDNLKKKLPENVTIKGPSGVVWNIGLTTRDDTVYFVDGWQRFVKDHSLKENDFLVFKYNGESLFEVLIFHGDSFCEKVASYFVGKCGNAQTEQGGRKAKDTNKSVSPEQFMVDAVTKTTPIAVPSQTNGKRTKKKPDNEVTPVQTKKRGRRPKAEAALSKLSSARVEKKIAQSFTSSFPYFVKMIKTFNVDGPRILNVPHQFSMAHFPNHKVKIILHNLKGEHWTVNSVPTTRVNVDHTICGGWMNFVRDNSIKIGDVCIFELIHECELRVRVAEVGKDGLDF